jgi:hypothetical protein
VNIYIFVITAEVADVVEALAQEFGHPPILGGVCRDEEGAIDVTARHWYDVGDYIQIRPHDGTLPDGSREFTCQTEYPETVCAVFLRLGGREITAEEVRS